MSDSTRKHVTIAVFALKCLAIVAILRPVLARHASKVVTVFAQAFPGAAASPDHHPRSYTYFSGFHVLSFSDVKWGLTLGVALYVAALMLQLAVRGRSQAEHTVQGRPAS